MALRWAPRRPDMASTSPGHCILGLEGGPEGWRKGGRDGWMEGGRDERNRGEK